MPHQYLLCGSQGGNSLFTLCSGLFPFQKTAKIPNISQCNELDQVSQVKPRKKSSSLTSFDCWLCVQGTRQSWACGSWWSQTSMACVGSWMNWPCASPTWRPRWSPWRRSWSASRATMRRWDQRWEMKKSDSLRPRVALVTWGGRIRDKNLSDFSKTPNLHDERKHCEMKPIHVPR